jgi:hypothetical protein
MIGKLAPKQYQGVMMGSWMMVTDWGSGVASKHLTLERGRAAKGRLFLPKESLHALALIPLAVSVSKSMTGSADSNEMLNVEI